MELNAMMASQLQNLQSLVQMSVMNKSLSMSTEAAANMLKEMPEANAAPHPYKGQTIDLKA